MLIFLAGLQGIPRRCTRRPRSTAPARCAPGGTSRCADLAGDLLQPDPWRDLQLPSLRLRLRDDRRRPARSTYFYVMHLYTQAFSSFDMGYGCALAWILFVIVLVITFIQTKLSNRWVHYESMR